MDLRSMLRLGPMARAAIAGAGGKTTALFQIARAYDSPVVITASTHLGEWQAQLADHHIVVTRPEDIEGAAGQIEGVTLITGPSGDDQRLRGLDHAQLGALHLLANRLEFPILVEADGARQKSLKAPADHEPVIPDWVDTVIVVAGLSGVGKTLDAASVHRPEKYSELSGLLPGDVITLESVVKVLISDAGGLKGIPPGARTIALFNQAGQIEDLAPVFEAVEMLVPPFGAALVASLVDQRILRVVEPVGAVILAAGGSSRFGQPKMLLPWQGKPLVRIAAEAALVGGAAEVIVVTGAADGPVRAALEGLPVRITHNPDWQAGQSTSIRAGILEMPVHIASVAFLLADQPFVTSAVIRSLIEAHAQEPSPVIAPRVKEQRANPVLFDRVTFSALSSLEGDTGGRAIFNRFPVRYIDWDDPFLLEDIDTPEDYNRLTRQERSDDA